MVLEEAWNSCLALGSHHILHFQHLIFCAVLSALVLEIVMRMSYILQFGSHVCCRNQTLDMGFVTVTKFIPTAGWLHFAWPSHQTCWSWRNCCCRQLGSWKQVCFAIVAGHVQITNWEVECTHCILPGQDSRLVAENIAYTQLRYCCLLGARIIDDHFLKPKFEAYETGWLHVLSGNSFLIVGTNNACIFLV